MRSADSPIAIDLMVSPRPLVEMQGLARRAHAVGFSGLAVADIARSAFLSASAATLAAPGLDIATAIAVAFPLSPMVTAQFAWELAETSGGRFRLGLGTQVEAHVVRRYSSEFRPPGPRMREYVEALRAIFAAFRHGTPLRFEGAYYSFSLLPEHWSPGPIAVDDPPIDLAAVNPWMLRMAGGVADGVHVHPLNTVGYLDEVVLPTVAEGAHLAGRDPDQVVLAVPCYPVVGDSEMEQARWRERARTQVAFYGSTANYAFLFERLGCGDVAVRLGECRRAGDAAGMAALVSDEILAHFTVAGTWDSLPRALVSRYAGRADRVELYNVAQDDGPDALDRWGDVAVAVRRLTEGRDGSGRPAEPVSRMYDIVSAVSKGLPMIRIGSGSAFDFDRFDWPLELAESGVVEYMSFDGLAERSIALAHVRRQANEAAGQDVRLTQLVEAFAPALRGGLRMVGNWGAANPEAGAEEVLAVLRSCGAAGTRVGVITGDDVRDRVVELDLELPEHGCRVSEVVDQVVAANCYVGAEGIVALLGEGAQFIMGGRIADPSLFVGPICHELGWALDDWVRLGIATVAGHVLECGPQASGAVFADPPYQVIPANGRFGFPYAEIDEAGDIVVSKLPGTGGVVNEHTVKLQLGYEIHDPKRYLTPDVTADLSQASVEQIAADRVRITGISGTERPETLKVLVGLDLGWKVTNDLGFAGPGCVERARFAEELFRQRIASLESEIVQMRCDVVGLNSIVGDTMAAVVPNEVRLRIAARCRTEAAAKAILFETMYIPWSTAGATGIGNPVVAPMIGVTPAYIPRSDVELQWQVYDA